MTKTGKRKRGAANLTQSGSDSSTDQINNHSALKSSCQKTVTSTPKEKLAKYAFDSNDTTGSDIPANKMAESGHTDAELTECALSPVDKQPSNFDLMKKLCAFGKEIEKLTSTVEEIKGTLFTVREESDALKREVAEAKQREEALRDQLKEARQLAEAADQRVEDLSAYVRRNNLRIYGLPESDGRKANGGAATEPETAQQCEERVVKMVSDKLKVNINRKDIEACHRVGVKRGDSQRGVIVRFHSRKVRDAVLSNRRNLKGTKTVIVEDLTPKAYSLLCQVKDDKDVCAQAWSRNGSVIMKSHSGKIDAIRSLAFLKDKTNRASWLATSRNVSSAKQS